MQKQPDYIVVIHFEICIGNNSLKKLQTLLTYHYIMKNFMNLKKGWSIS